MSDPLTTAQQLIELLNAQSPPNIQPTEEDVSNFRYILYVRKSTTSDERQGRSLQDQIDECNANQVDKYNLRPPFIVRESESAKEPDIRPKFREMLENIKRGKYDGIIAWHPDRLARNMKDAGEIIDLLDKRIIKDLRFSTFTFENSPMGKTLLGISFVLSKQYTDHLSESVNRGNRHRTEEGVYLGDAKHGYIKNSEGRLYPDGANWVLIKKAFEMRINNISNKEIASYLTNNYYKRSIWLEPRPMTEKRVSEILTDPFYAGVLIYGKNIVALEDIYDFTPVVSIENFMRINQFNSRSSLFKLAQSNQGRGVVKADFMRKMVICGECKHFMSSGITTKIKNNEKRYFYRCDTVGCSRKNKSIRPKVIVDFIYDFLDANYFATETAYEHYKVEMTRITNNNVLGLNKRLHALNLDHSQTTLRYNNTKRMLTENDTDLKEHYTDDLNNYKKRIEDISRAIKEVEEEKNIKKSSILEFKEFIELFKNAGVILRKTRSMKVKDEIVRKIFSNFVIKNESIEEFRLAEPFNTIFSNTFPAEQALRESNPPRRFWRPLFYQ